MAVVGAVPEIVFRVQWNDKTAQYPFGKGSIAYVSDVLELVTILHRKDVMIQIGYGANDLGATYHHMLYIFEIKDPSMLMEPSAESLNRAFQDMVRRSEATMDELKAAGLGEHVRKQINDFRRKYSELVTVLNKNTTSDLSIADQIKELIDEVNSPSFTDKYGPEDNYVLNDLNDPAKDLPNRKMGRIELYRIDLQEKFYTEKGPLPEEDPKYLILNLLNTYLSTYPQYTNNGYTLTVLGNHGFGEYHLLTEFKNKAIQTGFVEIKKNSQDYYLLREVIKEE